MSIHDDEKTRRKLLDRIIDDNSKWVDEQFGQVDMSDFVDFTKPIPEASFHDDKYAKPYDVGNLGAKQLHEFLDNPDTESLEQAAYETGDDTLVSEVQDQRAGAVSEEFIRRHPEYFGTDDNYFALLTQIAKDAGIPGEVEAEDLFARGVFTIERLEAAYKKLLRAGQLEVRPGTLRSLTAEQRQYCELLASRGDIPAAIANYVIYRLGKTAPSDVSETGGAEAAYRLLKKPEFRPLFEEAAFWCFEQITTDYVATPERQRFLEQYTKGRFVTVTLLQAVWNECKKAEQGEAKHRLIFGNNDETAETPMSFDDLTDQQISDLKNRTLQQRAQNIMSQKRRGRLGIK